LGRLYRAHGQPVSALQFQLKALEIHQTGIVPRLHIQSLNAVAVTYQALGDYDRARTYYERAIAAAESAGATGIPNILKANFGVCLAQVGEVERGRQLLEEAMAAGAGFTSLRYWQLSILNRKLGRYSDALAAAQKALDTCRTPVECREARHARAYAQLSLGN